MIGGSLLLAAASRRSSLLDGLVGYWPMNGNGNDVLGVSNGAALGTGGSFGAGKIGQAFYSGGAARYEVGSNAQIKPTTALSFGGWFWFNGAQAPNARLCADWHQNGALDRWILGYSPDGTVLYLHMFGVSVLIGTIGTHFAANSWVNLLGTWDSATGLMKTYLNASLSSSAGGLGGNLIAGVGGVVSLAQQSGGTVSGLDGRGCEFGMWNLALTQDNATEWYNAGAGKTHPFS